EKIAADLKNRAQKQAGASDLPDGVDDTAYVKGLQSTGKKAWIWIAAIVAAATALFLLAIF
ncbi:MAG TPA: hypothetical protein PLY16_03020, partial [Candidatus Saccharibacteria bacterium]|nr:hypothetical protein [Candidatus Saccharibacteria bacterium]